MSNTMKRTRVMWAFLALIPAAASAELVYAPHPGTVTATTYTPSGKYHGAVDISSGTCSQWDVQSTFMGSVYWNVTIRNTSVICYGNSSLSGQNEAVRTLSDGWTFRIWDFIRTSDSYDRTCDRCALGKEGLTGTTTGVNTHLHSDKLGTRSTAWYLGSTTVGETIDAGEVIGAL